MSAGKRQEENGKPTRAARLIEGEDGATGESAVILPEVFLKALAVARNLCKGVEGFSTANFDMIPQYRPRVNVVERPTRGKGRGFEFLGHHEIMIPLVFQALAEQLEG